MFVVTANNESKIWMNKTRKELMGVLPNFYGLKRAEVVVKEIPNAEIEIRKATASMSDEDRTNGVFFDIILIGDIPTLVKMMPVYNYNQYQDLLSLKAITAIKQSMDKPSVGLSVEILKESPNNKIVFDNLEISDSTLLPMVKKILGLEPFDTPRFFNDSILIIEEMKAL